MSKPRLIPIIRSLVACLFVVLGTYGIADAQSAPPSTCNVETRTLPGLSCTVGSTASETLYRSASGGYVFNNNTTYGKWVTCPLVAYAPESAPGTSDVVEVQAQGGYSGTMTCVLRGRTNSGSYNSSSFAATWDSPFEFDTEVLDLAPLASPLGPDEERYFYLTCYMPPGAAIFWYYFHDEDDQCS